MATPKKVTLEKTDNSNVVTLEGSKVQPESFALADGNTLLVADVVRDAFVLSGLKTEKEWNESDDDIRELYIAEAVAKLDLKKEEAEAGTNEDVVEANKQSVKQPHEFIKDMQNDIKAQRF